jgi:hypothetical protein
MDDMACLWNRAREREREIEPQMCVCACECVVDGRHLQIVRSTTFGHGSRDNNGINNNQHHAYPVQTEPGFREKTLSDIPQF